MFVERRFLCKYVSIESVIYPFIYSVCAYIRSLASSQNGGSEEEVETSLQRGLSAKQVRNRSPAAFFGPPCPNPDNGKSDLPPRKIIIFFICIPRPGCHQKGDSLPFAGR